MPADAVRVEDQKTSPPVLAGPPEPEEPVLEPDAHSDDMDDVLLDGYLPL